MEVTRHHALEIPLQKLYIPSFCQTGVTLPIILGNNTVKQLVFIAKEKAV